MNYFKVHLNKKPKKLQQRRVNTKTDRVALITAMSYVQIKTIKSNYFIDIINKKQRIASCVLDSSKAIQKIFSPKQKYLDRIKKVKP